MKMQNLKEHLEEVQEKIGYCFENVDLLFQAFTRKSYSQQHGGESNEVLEFIGDSVLSYYAVRNMMEDVGYLKSASGYYDGKEDADEFCTVGSIKENDLTELKNKMVSNQTFARVIDQLGLAKYMYLGTSDLSNQVANQEKVKADLFEAIAGAIAIDCDYNEEVLAEFVENILNPKRFLRGIDFTEPRPEKFQLDNAVTTLKEMAEHGRCSAPEYIEYNEPVRGRDGQPVWQCICRCAWRENSNYQNDPNSLSRLALVQRIDVTAHAKSKKAAKKYAAYKVLCLAFDIEDEYEE